MKSTAGNAATLDLAAQGENERCRMMEQDSDPGRFNSATGK